MFVIELVVRPWDDELHGSRPVLVMSQIEGFDDRIVELLMDRMQNESSLRDCLEDAQFEILVYFDVGNGILAPWDQADVEEAWRREILLRAGHYD